MFKIRISVAATALAFFASVTAGQASNTVTIDTAGSPTADVSDWSDETCIADSDPCDDFPNQQDATGACIASNFATVSPATEAYLRFDFDTTSVTGQNSVDGCWLVDTNQNGNADRALCFSLVGNPVDFRATGGVRFFTCNDSSPTKCNQEVEVFGTSATCAVNNNTLGAARLLQSCGAAADAAVECSVSTTDLGWISGDIALVKGCSSTSAQPNSATFDCMSEPGDPFTIDPETGVNVPPGATPTPTATPTDTPEPTSTPTATSTDTPVDTSTPTATSTDTPVDTSTPTATSTNTPVDTSTPTATSTNTPVDTSTATATSTNTPVDTSTATATSTNTPVSTSTATATSTNTPVSTSTATATSTNTPVDTSTATATSTNTPVDTSTATATSTNTPVDTSTATATSTNTPVDTSTATATSTNTPVDTSTATATSTNTPVDTSTATATSTNTPVDTSTATATSTNTPVDTSTATATSTNTPVDTSTATATSTNTPVDTSTATATSTNTPVDTSTATATATDTPVSTSTATATDTPVPTSTETPAPTETNTFTATQTAVPTATATFTSTETPEPTVTTTATSTETPIPTGLHNLGFAVGRVAAEGRWSVFGVKERRQHIDLNFDGDRSDEVAHYLNASTGSVVNTGLAVRNFKVAGSHAALAVMEARSNRQDLNGDGDRRDIVLHVVDLNTGAVTNTMQSMHKNLFDMDENNIVIHTSESAQKSDLNGDGDRGDHVVQVWNLASGTLTSTGLDAAHFVFAGDHIALAVREGKQNATDLSGDSDRKDMVLHVYEISSGTTQNLGFVLYRPQVRLKISPTAVLFTVNEGKDGLGDLNGDGRKNDEVAKVFLLGSSTMVDVDMATTGKNMDIGLGMAAFAVPEREQGGTDLNGDGDLRDKVIHVVDLSSGAVTNLGAQGDKPGVTGNAVVFRSIENAAGKTDLNGDGDRGDRVLRVYDGDDASLTDLDSAKRFRRQWFKISGTRIVFISRERRAAKTDLNSDGDIRDNVVQVYDIATKTLTNSGVQAKNYTVGPELVAIATIERNQGRTDFNGDGDTRRDIALNVFHMPTATLIPVPVAIQWKSMAVGDEYVTFAVRERTHFNQILNGDNDKIDDVLFCVGPLP